MFDNDPGSWFLIPIVYNDPGSWFQMFSKDSCSWFRIYDNNPGSWFQIYLNDPVFKCFVMMMVSGS